MFEERALNKTEYELLEEEREKFRAKFENVKQLYEFEVAKNASFKQEQYARLSQLECERQALIENNEQLQDRIKAMEDCDVDSAAIEVARATKTI